MGAGFYEIYAKPASTKVGVEVKAELGNRKKNEADHFRLKSCSSNIICVQSWVSSYE